MPTIVYPDFYQSSVTFKQAADIQMLSSLSGKKFPIERLLMPI